MMRDAFPDKRRYTHPTPSTAIKISRMYGIKDGCGRPPELYSAVLSATPTLSFSSIRRRLRYRDSASSFLGGALVLDFS